MWRQRLRRFTLQTMVASSGRERRRLWVAVMYSGLAGWTIQSVMMSLPSLKSIVSGWIFFAVFFSFAALGALGFLFTAYAPTHVSHGLKVETGPQDGALDERQEAVWGRASRKAYTVLLAVLPIVTVYLIFVWPLLRLPGEEALTLLSVAVFLLTLSLPNAIVAWTEPDAEGDG